MTDRTEAEQTELDTMRKEQEVHTETIANRIRSRVSGAFNVENTTGTWRMADQGVINVRLKKDVAQKRRTFGHMQIVIQKDKIRSVRITRHQANNTELKKLTVQNIVAKLMNEFSIALDEHDINTTRETIENRIADALQTRVVEYLDKHQITSRFAFVIDDGRLRMMELDLFEHKRVLDTGIEGGIWVRESDMKNDQLVLDVKMSGITIARIPLHTLYT